MLACYLPYTNYLTLIEKTGEVQVLPQNKSYISVINNYSMIVATRPDPTVRPPSRIHWK